MKSKPDDRSNNVPRIQHNIDHTIQNIELANEMISKTDDETLREELTAKNERREQALDGMREEIRDEAKHRQNQHHNKKN